MPVLWTNKFRKNKQKIVTTINIDETMESQQPEYINTDTPAVIGASEPAPLQKLLPAAQSDQQWRRIGTQISTFLAQLPDYLGNLFNEYKQPIISVALIAAAIISVKVVFAVINTLNGIPLLAPTFEVVGIGYSVWFVNRYLLKASNRQELSKDLQKLKQQLVGSQQLPKSLT